MEQIKYWFLNLVVEFVWELAILEDDNLELHINGSGHGLGHAQLMTTLCQLFQEQLLICWRAQGEAFVPTLQEMERGLRGEEAIFLGLTGRGGQEWEAVSQPDWSRYINAWTQVDPDCGEITCANPDLAQRFLMMNPDWEGLVENSIEWEVLTPWSATYWKTLSLGHRATFRLNAEANPGQSQREYQEKLEQCWQMRKWYVNPCE